MDKYKILKEIKNFLEKTNTKMEIKFLKYDVYFSDEKTKRDIYVVKLIRGSRKYEFNYGNSLFKSGVKIQTSTKEINITSFLSPLEEKVVRNGGKLSDDIIHKYCDGYAWKLHDVLYPEVPDEYDILTALTKYDPGTFEEFCKEYGYNTDSIKDHKIYMNVVKEWKNICMLWTDEEIEELKEIN